jgi:hypothetical protein
MNEAKQATGTKDDFNHDPTAPSAVPPSQQIGEEDKVKRGTDGTIEELGGKKDAGPPSGLDKGALEKGGEAQGTISSPGPTAQEVAQYHSQVNGNAPAEAERPGIEKFWKVSARMEPHLQLMYVYLIIYWRHVADIRCGPLLAYYTVKDGMYQGAAMVVCPFLPIP